jgi:catechol 2,3-dioxygenase-like lactoylglutathione lyase family enzyme
MSSTVRLGHVSLPSAQPDQLAGFYRDLLGLEVSMAGSIPELGDFVFLSRDAGDELPLIALCRAEGQAQRSRGRKPRRTQGGPHARQTPRHRAVVRAQPPLLGEPLLPRSRGQPHRGLLGHRHQDRRAVHRAASPRRSRPPGVGASRPARTRCLTRRPSDATTQASAPGGCRTRASHARRY